MSIKEQLYQTCKKLLQSKLQTIHLRLEDLAEDLTKETKSSVGDKYETGRAMLHREKDKILRQLHNLKLQNQLLQAIDIHKNYSKGQLGALISTSSGHYFLAIGLGKVKLENQTFLVISPQSPIGQLLLQKKAKDRFIFRQKTIEVIAIN